MFKKTKEKKKKKKITSKLSRRNNINIKRFLERTKLFYVHNNSIQTSVEIKIFKLELKFSCKT